MTRRGLLLREDLYGLVVGVSANDLPAVIGDLEAVKALALERLRSSEEPPLAELEDLLDALLPDDAGWVLMLRAYFDASSREKGVFCVAGCLFSPSDARSFSLAAQRAFSSWGGMHMADLCARRGMFAGIGSGERDDLVRKATAIVSRYMTAGVAVSCWAQDVRAFGPNWIEGFSNAYSVCCHLAASTLGGWLRERYPGGSGGVAYVFENGDRFRGEASALLGLAARGDSPLRASYQYRSHAFMDKREPLLGAADFLAWEWAKYWDETVSDSKRPMRRSLAALLADGWDWSAGRNPKYRLLHVGGERFVRFLGQIRDLGLDQLHEQALETEEARLPPPPPEGVEP